VNEEYATVDNPYRVAGPYVAVSFGLVDIDWDTQGDPSVTLRAIGLDGQNAFEFRLSNPSH
jgi:hypothetical protein